MQLNWEQTNCKKAIYCLMAKVTQQYFLTNIPRMTVQKLPSNTNNTKKKTARQMRKLTYLIAIEWQISNETLIESFTAALAYKILTDISRAQWLLSFSHGCYMCLLSQVTLRYQTVIRRNVT